MEAHIARGRAVGVIRPPGSKSYTIRAVLCAALAEGHSTVQGALESDDSSAILSCVRGLGAGAREDVGLLGIDGLRGMTRSSELHCGESGATFRFLLAIAAAIPARTVVRCAPSLARRPVRPLLASLEELGALCELDSATGTVTVIGTTRRGGDVHLKGGVSSQFLSGLLLSGPLYPDGLDVHLDAPTVSQRYVAMTMHCMNAFGAKVEVTEGGRHYRVVPAKYRPTDYRVEADWSAAAPLLALGAIGGDVTVQGIGADSLQADVRALALLRSAGARLEPTDDGFRATGSGLREYEMYIDDAIDLLPIGCAVGAVARGRSVIRGIERARDKESDRVASMADGLDRCSVPVSVEKSRMLISGGSARGSRVSSFNDHRIAMAFGVLGSATGGMIVEDAGCVAKTYPGFWDDLRSLRVEVECRE